MCQLLHSDIWHTPVTTETNTWHRVVVHLQGLSYFNNIPGRGEEGSVRGVGSASPILTRYLGGERRGVGYVLELLCSSPSLEN